MGNAKRPDRDGTHRLAFEHNKKRIYATQTICAICGKPVDKSLKFPNPMSKSVDHIIPVSRGGHPSDIDNLQLAHLACNREKSDKLYGESKASVAPEKISNQILPLSRDWSRYKG